ncbi:alpha-amylase family protein [Mycobacterium sp.]|jgi:cyclomaltodextrinase|uniref:alpha-amylase family protein n=1 Tax=Mycobacterium sp. TaxID=1785 RepID=UPI002D60032C|nr:alpha-amylase family protein [Mycobacterium sp.]HZA09974.1 alpha-amylase family protein [Mycobacterium sp.]
MTEPRWVQHAIWWQIYPLGFVGAYPAESPPAPAEHRLRRIVDWLDHAIELGTSGIALGPIFASRTHGYDTTDHYRIDARLGDDADFDHLVDEAHRRGLRVLLDGVFNHVGVDFERYRQARDDPSTADSWFLRRRNDFDTFEGHGELITLNHSSAEVVSYVIDVMDHWLERGADGWRLDAAYAVPDPFWAKVIAPVRTAHPDAWFLGEVIHGDYAARVRDAKFDSVTQYELWKAIWSSLNDGNFYELDWALQRHNEFLSSFVPQTFIGNHDVTRIATQLDDPRHLPHAVVILMTTAGTPSIYAGDEYGLHGVKEERFGGDDAIRPEFGLLPAQQDPHAEDVLRLHRFLIGLRRRLPWLRTATTEAVRLDNRQYVYQTRRDDAKILVALNISDDPLTIALRDHGFGAVRVLGGAGSPPPDTVDEATVGAHEWLILQPA